MTASFTSSLASLRAAQKSSAGAPLYSVLINRPLGRVFAAAAHVIGLTPNQVTAISAVFTFTGVIVIAAAPPVAAVGVVVAALLIIGYALDAADGQLARLRGGGSPSGEWLDHTVDSLKNTVLHIAVLVMIHRFVGVDSLWQIVPLVFISATVVHFFGMLLTELLGRLHADGSAAPRQPSTLLSAAKLPTDYGLLCASFLLLGLTPVFLVVYGLMTLATLGYTALVLPRWYARVKALPSRPRATASGESSRDAAGVAS